MAVVVSGVALFQGQLSASCTSDLLQGEAPGRSVLGSQVTQPPEKREISFFISIQFVVFCYSSRD